MSRRSSASVRLWLVAALFGLSSLLPAGAVARGSATTGQFFLQNDRLMPEALAYAPVADTESIAPARLRHLSHALLPRASAPAPFLPVTHFVTPRFADRLTARRNAPTVVATWRPAGYSRAPPAA
jgi:hypothetical protein